MNDFGSIDEAIRATDAESRAFERRYGPWKPMTVPEASDALVDFDGVWWVCGGQAIDAFTGTERRHDDLDIGFFASDLTDLRRALEPTFDLWSAGSGMLRPLDDDYPELHAGASQVWAREHAWAPWRLDLLATPGGAGLWINKRDESQVLGLGEATWTDDDGIRYLAPELVLSMKASQGRPKDELDLQRSLPLLAAGQRERLRDLLTRVHPGHAWITRLGSA